ncbi:MAG: sialidase family protein [Lentisphaeria bacterium]|jgi:hypothetical protein|nr:sialidase family protein [Lentisphaeria bacterium]
MPLNAEIKKDVLIPAAGNPDVHEFYWAVNVAYTSNDGPGMVMTAVRRMSSGDDNWRQRQSTNQRWISGDNGATWSPHGPEISGGSYDSKNTTLAWMHFLDPSNERLLSLHQTSRPHPGDGAWATALHYEISSDAGRAWGPAKQVIHPDSAGDELHWMPGITDNYQYIGVDQAPLVRLDDGTIVLGFTVHPAQPDYPREQFYCGCVFLRGRWTDGQDELTWEAGDIVQVRPEVSPYGACEPDLLHLGGQRLLTTMRCQGEYEPAGVFSTRHWSISEDGGKTWSDPRLLCYENGSMVCVPASLAAFERDPQTGRVFWFANILDSPVTDQLPRWPLAMAELDTERICLVKDSVTTIQDFPDGAPANRSYTNFGHYVDRATGEFVLTPAEMPKFSVKDFRADTVRYRIKVN